MDRRVIDTLCEVSNKVAILNVTVTFITLSVYYMLNEMGVYKYNRHMTAVLIVAIVEFLLSALVLTIIDVLEGVYTNSREKNRDPDNWF